MPPGLHAEFGYGHVERIQAEDGAFRELLAASDYRKDQYNFYTTLSLTTSWKMLRRAGVFSAPADLATLIPTASDPPGVLEAKWAKFITRESYKRYVRRCVYRLVLYSLTDSRLKNGDPSIYP